MPCSKVSINKNNKCDKAGCICISAIGKTCICLCENEQGDIMQCDDCKCVDSDECQCKCDDSKCTCIVTKGASCICICRDEKGNFKACEDCSCVEIKDARSCKKESTIDSCECCSKLPKKETCGRNCECNENKNYKGQRRVVTTSKNYKCDKDQCVCLLTDGKSCICVCEDDDGAIVRCDDCKCNNTGKCQCKCDDSNCTCIVTKGADCICICRDGRGNLKACDDCSCVETKNSGCCTKRSTSTIESSACSSKNPLKETYGRNCASVQKKNNGVQRRTVTFNKSYKCDKAGCVCLPTDRKACICVCEDDAGAIVRCDDCQCNNNGNCQCKCDVSKCTCILTEGADCICVCRDGRGNFKACNDCFCFDKNLESTIKTCGCCSKAPKKEKRNRSTECGEKKGDTVQRCVDNTRKNYRCDKAECICLPTGGKSCICVYEDDNNGEIVRCDDCKCYENGNCECKCDDSKCTCIVTKGADCICVCRDVKGNFKTCDDCSCAETKNTNCCKKIPIIESTGCRSKAPKKETCSRNCACVEKDEYKVHRRPVSTNNNYKCDKAECVCLPTHGKSCICVCEDDDGAIVQCDDCKCNNNGNCQCKCDVSKCTCIFTEGADCICVCRDGIGNLKACNDCFCVAKKSNSTVKTCGCCSKAPNKETRSRSSECYEKKDDTVQRRAATIRKNYRCDKAECICLPTGGKSCVCVCEDDNNGEIVRCDDCKCYKNGNCECKCDDTKCTCIVTKGPDCICVCRDVKGNLKACNDCSCAETKNTNCCKKESTIESKECHSKAAKQDTCGRNCGCVEKEKYKVQRRGVTASNNYKRDKAECVCLQTDGKCCICVCEDDNGHIMRCDDCKCHYNGNSNCTCILTKGADCICVCRDGRGNLKACDDCSCVGTKTKSCFHKRSTLTVESCRCCSTAPKKETCGKIFMCDEKKDYRVQRRPVDFTKNYKCDKAGCVCLPTDGKSCICVCENDDGAIVRCDDCKCNNTGNYQYKCDDSNCTCIVTKGADCVCICRDGRGNLKVCDDCSCVATKTSGCCNKRSPSTFESYACCLKAPKKYTCGRNYENNEKKIYKVQRSAVTTSKNYKCNKADCVCLPTGGKLCICACEDDNGEIVRCDDYKCYENGDCDDSKCTCIVTKGADCFCICRDVKGNLKTCDDCSCAETKNTNCCQKGSTIESKGCRSKATKINQYNTIDGHNARATETSQSCNNPKHTSSCCKTDRKQEIILKTRDCICTYKKTRYHQIVGDGSTSVTKEVTKSCACYY